jgi:hypothetical protein
LLQGVASVNLFRAKTVNFLFPYSVASAMIACGGDKNSDETPVDPMGNPGAWLIPSSQIVDGGPGSDGIPAIGDPQFVSAASAKYIANSDLAIAARYGGEVKIYPHHIVDWHEIVNDESAVTVRSRRTPAR